MPEERIQAGTLGRELISSPNGFSKQGILDETQKSSKAIFELTASSKTGRGFYAANQRYGLNFKERKDIHCTTRQCACSNIRSLRQNAGLFYTDFLQTRQQDGGALDESTSVDQPVCWKRCRCIQRL